MTVPEGASRSLGNARTEGTAPSNVMYVNVMYMTSALGTGAQPDTGLA